MVTLPGWFFFFQSQYSLGTQPSIQYITTFSPRKVIYYKNMTIYVEKIEYKFPCNLTARGYRRLRCVKFQFTKEHFKIIRWYFTFCLKKLTFLSCLNLIPITSAVRDLSDSICSKNGQCIQHFNNDLIIVQNLNTRNGDLTIKMLIMTFKHRPNSNPTSVSHYFIW